MVDVKKDEQNVQDVQNVATPPRKSLISDVAQQVLLPRRTRRSRLAIIISGSISVMLTVAIVVFKLPPTAVGGLALLLMIALLLTGVPIGFGMLFGGILGLWKLTGPTVVASTLSSSFVAGTFSWELTTIPLFVLMGIAMGRSGLSTQVYTAAKQWMGWLPGGLAVGTNFAGAGLSAVSGTSVGISYALGRIAIPEMMRANYSPRLASGVVTIVGVLGQLIPPSLLLVIYAGIAGVSVGSALLASLVPGVLIAVGFAAYIVIHASIDPKIAPRVSLTDITWGSRFRSLIGLIPTVIVMIIVLGGLYGGFVTATEAGALGAFAALVVGWLFSGKEMRKPRNAFRFLRESLIDTVMSTAAIFLLVICVGVLTRLMSISRVASELTELVVSLKLDRVGFLLILVLVFLVLGLFLDSLAMMLLTIPVLIVPLQALDVDMVWFGVFILILAEIGTAHPPLGILLYVVHRISQRPEVNLGHKFTLGGAFLGVLPFLAVALGFLILFIFVPDIVMYLPNSSVNK